MSERHVTEREFAALGLRILGVYILLSGLVEALFLLPSLFQGDWSTWGVAWLLALLTTLVFLGAVALPLIFHSDTIVVWLFPRSDKAVAFALSGRDLVTCGLALVGAWLVANNVPYLARLASEVVWLAEATRRSQLDPTFFSQTAFEALGSVFACVAGAVLFRFSGRITDWWEAGARGES